MIVFLLGLIIEIIYLNFHCFSVVTITHVAGLVFLMDSFAQVDGESLSERHWCQALCLVF